jgi:hypothetical protein
LSTVGISIRLKLTFAFAGNGDCISSTFDLVGRLKPRQMSAI